MQLRRIGWLTNKDVSLIMRERLCSSCVQDSMLHGRNENVMALPSKELSWTCTVVGLWGRAWRA